MRKSVSQTRVASEASDLLTPFRGAYVEITVPASNVDAALTDFPFVVTGRDMPAEFWSQATADTIEVQDANGDPLPTELAWFYPDSQLFRIHTKIDLSDTVSTVFRIAWGVVPRDLQPVFTDYLYVVPLRVKNLAQLKMFGEYAYGFNYECAPRFDINDPCYLTADNGYDDGIRIIRYNPVEALRPNKDFYLAINVAVTDKNLTNWITNVEDQDFRIKWDSGANGIKFEYVSTEFTLSPNFNPAVDAFHTYHQLYKNTVEGIGYADGANKTTFAYTVDPGANRSRLLWIGGFSTSTPGRTKIKEYRYSDTLALTATDAYIKMEHLNMENLTDYTVT